MKSSVNIPSCREVILRRPAMKYFENKTVLFPVHTPWFRRKDLRKFVTYKDSIEQNLYALIATKERLTEFMKYGELKEQVWNLRRTRHLTVIHWGNVATRTQRKRKTLHRIRRTENRCMNRVRSRIFKPSEHFWIKYQRTLGTTETDMRLNIEAERTELDIRYIVHRQVRGECKINCVRL